MADRIYEGELYDQEIDLTPQDEIFLVVDNSTFEKPKKMPLSMILNQSNIDIILSNEYLSALGWTSTGWTGSWADGWIHTAGNTSVLASTLAAIVANSYLINISVVGRTAGSFTVAFGGTTTGAQTASNSFSIVATTIGNFQITPTSDFDGELFVSVKQVNFELTEQQILDTLGVDDVVQSSQLAGYVSVVSGSSLITDAEKSRLANIRQNVYELLLSSASSVSSRITEATIPSGWTLAADSVVNLKVTHNLTGRKCVDVKVWEVDGSNERLAKPFSDAYSGISNTGLDVLIEGLDTIVLPLRVELIFS